MKLTYPALFIESEEVQGAYTVEFPDLPGCVTYGEDMAEAIFMAEDAASGWVLTSLEDGEVIPKASKVQDMEVPKNGFVSVILLDIDKYSEKYGNKAVKKTLTIPAWLNSYTESNNISCSKVLQEALFRMLQVE